MKDYEIKLPEAIKETENKIYKVDYQEKAIGYGYPTNCYIIFADKKKALEFADGIANRTDILYVAVTERTAVDGGIYEPSGLVKEWGKEVI